MVLQGQVHLVFVRPLSRHPNLEASKICDAQSTLATKLKLQTKVRLYSSILFEQKPSLYTYCQPVGTILPITAYCQPVGTILPITAYCQPVGTILPITAYCTVTILDNQIIFFNFYKGLPKTDYWSSLVVVDDLPKIAS